MTITIDKSEFLLNECQSEKIAKCSAALWAHEVTMSTQMFMAEEDHHFMEVAYEYLETYQGQEVIIVEIGRPTDHEDCRTVAIIYDKEDLVLVCSDFTLDEDRCFEVSYSMTTAGFFSYLQSIPNIKKHIRQSDIDEKTFLGLELLDELAKG